jgi:hypothetical protein
MKQKHHFLRYHELAEVLKMQVPTDPGGLVEEILFKQVFVEQVAGAAQEGEGMSAQGPILQCQTFGIAPCVVRFNALDDSRFGHTASDNAGGRNIK